MFAREKKKLSHSVETVLSVSPQPRISIFLFLFFFFTLQTICSQTDDGNVSVVNLSTLLNTVALLA